MIDNIPPDTDLFVIELSHITDENPRWRRNTSLDVMTTSAARAIEVAMAYCESRGWSEAKVHVVRRRGQGTLVVDPELA